MGDVSFTVQDETYYGKFKKVEINQAISEKAIKCVIILCNMW